jgi:mono/diheme cytochrome c family protein
VTGAVTGGVTLTGITATLAHIHSGIAGTNGPVIVNFVQSGTDPNRWDAEAGGTLTADEVNALLAGQLYVNVHSAAFPSGEIRGQIRPQGIAVAVAGLDDSSVVPPVSNSATGLAAMTVNEAANTATVHVQTTGVDDATEAHVHNAPAGENASAPLFSLMKDPATPSHWLLEGQAVTQADRDALAANRLYVDVHTPAAMAGALRGQLSLNAAAPPPPPASTVTLAQLQSSIFTPICSGCHTGGGSSLPSSMNLTSASASFAALVGVASTEQPSVLRVSAGNPDASYLVRKIEGAAGITGGRMPLGGAPLDPALIANVRTWITEGAQNN